MFKLYSYQRFFLAGHFHLDGLGSLFDFVENLFGTHFNFDIADFFSKKSWFLFWLFFFWFFSLWFVELGIVFFFFRSLMHKIRVKVIFIVGICGKTVFIIGCFIKFIEILEKLIDVVSCLEIVWLKVDGFVVLAWRFLSRRCWEVKIEIFATGCCISWTYDFCSGGRFGLLCALSFLRSIIAERVKVKLSKFIIAAFFGYILLWGSSKIRERVVLNFLVYTFLWLDLLSRSFICH